MRSGAPLLVVWLASGAVAVGWPGCAAVIDASSELGDTCRFDGDEETSCGLCAATACRAQVDACCGDPDCAPALSILDGCSDGDEEDCDTLFEADGFAEALGACMARSCKASCAVGESVTYCIGSSSSCFCTYETTVGLANDEPCNTGTVGGGICCADIGYPDVGLGCDCNGFRCRETADGCECGSGEGPLTSCSGTYCCATTSGCACGESPCADGTERVEACTVDLYGCGEDSVQIDACSAVK